MNLENLVLLVFFSAFGNSFSDGAEYKRKLFQRPILIQKIADCIKIQKEKQ